MLPKINPTTTKAWQQLHLHAAEMKQLHMKELFKKDNERFKKFALCFDEIVFDYSKNIVNDKTIHYLLQLAEECGVRTNDGTFIELTENNEELAARLGTVRELVSRNLGRLHGEGLIQMRRRAVSIPDEAKLRAELRS